MRQQVRAFAHNQDGLAAVEFAFIAPVMLLLFFGAVELSDALLADRKVTAVASSVADLVAQDSQIDDSGINDIFMAAEAILAPYDTTQLTIRVSQINVETDGTTRVGWSDALRTTAYSPGMNFSLPDGISQPGGSVIVSEITFTYQSIVSHFITGNITLTDGFYARPRKVLRIERVS